MGDIIGLNPVFIHTIAITVVDGAASQVDTITIDGVACTFVSDVTPTTTEISTGLQAAIAASSIAGKFVVSGTTNVVLTPSGAYNPGVMVSANLTDVITFGTPVLGTVMGDTKDVTVSPVVTAGAYHANDIVGGTGAGAGLGINTNANAARVTGGTGKLDSIVVRDLAMQNAVLQIWLFSATPAAGTYTDNGAFGLHDTDSALCIGVVTIATTDYVSATDNSIATLCNIGLDYKVAATSMFAIFRTTGTPTYAATSDLSLTFNFLRN